MYENNTFLSVHMEFLHDMSACCFHAPVSGSAFPSKG